jgi:UPF0755 protein
MNDRQVISRRARPVLDNPRHRPRSRATTWAAAIFALAALIVIALVVGVGGLYWSLHRPQGSASRATTFRVVSGDTVTSVADRLERLGYIDNTLLFRLDAKLHDLSAKLKAGDYPLRPGMSIDDAVVALTVYHAKTISVTIPEGYRIEQMAATLSRKGLDGASFMREALHPTISSPILTSKPAGASLQGFLFPNTYDVSPHFGGKAFARLMVDSLNRAFTPSMLQRARARGMSVYQVLTLASIVEREAKVESERPIIASVYLNRLKIGMPLQADPTVQYAVGTSKDWWPMLTTDQLRIQNPYNTYVNKGLPPGPIANPGLASIRAVLHPASTHFLFFVAKGHGRHAFARTYQQQCANQLKYENVSC